MKIEILGTGCPKCKKLTELVEEAVKELDISAEIIKITDINKIINYGVMMTHALVIDGEVKMESKLHNKKDIINWIKNKN